MSNGPETLEDFGNGWSLKRWQYDDAPLELHGPGNTLIQFGDKNLGDLEIEFDEQAGWSGGYQTVRRFVPRAALVAFLDAAAPQSTVRP